MTRSLSADYRLLFTDLHRAVAAMPLAAIPLTSFWPMVGGHYDGELLVVGRAVNSWRTEWTAQEARSEGGLASVVEDAIATNTVAPNPMDWVVRLWGNEGSRFDGFADSRYNTARSAFWRVCRELSVSGPWHRPADSWSGYLAWTNLYNVAPAAGWNPGGDLLGAQRGSAADLLAAEIADLQPLAGPLGLRVDWRSGLVEGAVDCGSTRWVIAKHPMGKPQQQWLAEVRSALS